MYRILGKYQHFPKPRTNVLEDSGLLGYDPVSLGSASRHFEGTKCLYLTRVMGYKKGVSRFSSICQGNTSPSTPHYIPEDVTVLMKSLSKRPFSQPYDTSYSVSIYFSCRFALCFPSNPIPSCAVSVFLNAFESVHQFSRSDP